MSVADGDGGVTIIVHFLKFWDSFLLKIEFIMNG